MVLELPGDWTQYKKEIAPRLRQVKKAQKAGLEIRWGKGEDLLADFYRFFPKNEGASLPGLSKKIFWDDP